MNLYKEHILELYRHPENYGELKGATHIRREHNPLCGDDLTFYVIVKDGKIADVTFTGNGCAISKASASLITDYVKGLRTSHILSLDSQLIIDLLGIDVGPVRLKCALLPLVGIQHALEETP